MIWSSLDRYRDVGLLVARIGFGLGFLWFHGWGKITGGTETWARVGGAMGNFGISFAPEWWGLAASLAESVGGVLIALGLVFRPTAAALAIVMIVAATNHIVSGQGTPAHAFKNAWLFAGFVLIGPGKYSLDFLLSGRRAAAGERSPMGSPARARG